MKFLKQISIGVLCICSIAFVGCGGSSKETSSEPSGDANFIKVASKAINKRWDDQSKKDISGYAEGDYVKILEAENKTLEEAISEIKDEKLLKAAKDYIEGNKLSIKSNVTTDEELVYEYIEQSEVLRKPALIAMVDDFGLVINDNNKQIYEDFKVKATVINKDNDAKKFAEKLATEIKFEVAKEYSWTKCAATVENTSEFNFESIYYNVQFKDADGVVVDNGTFALNNFTKGSKQKADVSTDKEYETIEVTLDSLYLKE